ncbi:hypothetical protein FOZ63_015199 [Perkinsus olseni]|uniref:EF-hand domain-containing protein n=1 Tax=Perkinsus olseni TaxID=32597 RepID=A0A7J6TEU6_PEROL|nr:hypothetical protein FOZ63_015199 [Perkinsus olseni]
MMYEQLTVHRAETAATRASESMVSEHEKYFALGVPRKGDDVSDSYAEQMHFHKSQLAQNKKSIKKLLRELARPLPPEEVASVAVGTPRWWKSSPIGKGDPFRRSIASPRLRLGRNYSRTAREQGEEIDGDGMKSPRDFIGPLKPTIPRTPKDTAERKREGNKAIRSPRRKRDQFRLTRIAAGRPDLVKMGQRRGKTTSFEVWLKRQREIEAREAEEAAAKANAHLFQLFSRQGSRQTILCKKSVSIELPMDFNHSHPADLLRSRSLQPEHVSKLTADEEAEVAEEEEEEKAESEKSETGSSKSSIEDIRVVRRPRMPIRASGLISHGGDVHPTLDMLPTIFMHIATEEESRLRQLAKRYGMSILDVEKIKQEFDKYDVDASGAIEKEEFHSIVRNILGAKEKYDLSQKRLEEFWKMLDADDSGSVTLEEFLGFFWKYFWTRGGDVPGAQVNLLDCIGRVPPWSDERIEEIALGGFLATLGDIDSDEDDAEESEDEDEDGKQPWPRISTQLPFFIPEEACIEPESARSKLVRTVLSKIVEKRIRSNST